MEETEKELPKRKKLRLSDFDYSKNGAYFITLCIKEKIFLLWDAEKTKRITENFTVVNVGANCVRPDNVPLSEVGKVIDREIKKLNEIYDSVIVEKYCIMPDHIHMIIGIMPDKNGRTQFAPTLSRTIKQFKGKVTKCLGFSVWQRSFLDMVIRNEKGYKEVWEYIDYNPYKYFYKQKKQDDEKQRNVI